MSAPRVRSISRCLDSARAALWLIDDEGKIAHVSSTLADLLGISTSDLLGRRCNQSLAIDAGLAQANPLDAMAVALAPASDLEADGHQTIELTIPFSADPSKRGRQFQAHLVRLPGSEDGPWFIGFLGDFPVPTERSANGMHGLVENHVARIRSELDRWSIRQQPLIESLWAGESRETQLLRSRIQLSTQVRSHVGVFGHSGCGSDQILRWLLGRPSSAEPHVVLDGPLMDAELICVYAASVLDALSHSNDAKATLVIDRIDEMADEAQHVLAGWLQDHPQRLRLIASVHNHWHRDSSGAQEDEIAELAQQVAAPQSVTGLHPQITAALATLPLVVPDLNDRMADLPLLAAAWLHHLNAIPPGQTARKATSDSSRIAAKQLDREAMDSLVAYPWPGQWDELGAALRHADKASDNPSIQRDHLPLAIRTYGQSGHRLSDLNVASTASLDERINEFEAQLIWQAMEDASGNKAEAARQLKISRARLLRKLETLGDNQT